MDNLIIHGQQVDKPGETASIWNGDTNELFIHHWDILTNIGKKYVISNAFTRTPAGRRLEGVIPIYDYYKEYFNMCDHYNRNLHDRKYPHRCGGSTKSGEEGHIHKFILACTLQNIFAIFGSIQVNTQLSFSFKQNCTALSDEICSYAMQLPN